mgnify:CR=1 FL=1|tara:strand:- start:621 stop:1025 length:405 start_codon:yes stop_codon:yes gene_type:complete
MVTTVNASTSSGLVNTADTSGIIKLQSNGVTTNALAWVNFNGTSSTPITPRANYNISSVTKISTGYYTLNFTSALTDINYVVIGSVGNGDTTSFSVISASQTATPTTSSVSIYITNLSGTVVDRLYVNVAIFGN